MSKQEKIKLGGSHLFYRFISSALYIVYWYYFRIEHRGTENIPKATDPRGVILAPNHVSYVDPPVLGVTVKRRVTFLAKEYLFRHSLVGFVLRGIGAYPIKSGTGNDLKSIRDLIRLLKAGHCVAVFPEGTRSETGEMKEPESGIGFLAMKSGAWVVPVYIQGSFEALPKDSKRLKKTPIKVWYGEPFIPADNKAFVAMGDYMAVSETIMKEIKLLKAKAEQV